MVEAAGQGGDADVDEAAGTAELSPPLTWSRDGLEGSPPTDAGLVVDVAYGDGGRTRVVVCRLPELLTQIVSKTVFMFFSGAYAASLPF